MSLNMFLPSLAGMAEDLRAAYWLVSLSVAGYLGVTAVLQLLIGPLSDCFGRRPVLLAALAIFAAASVGCMLATDIRVFLGFRVLQGVIIAGWVVSLAVIRDTSAAAEAAGRIGYMSMAMAVAPMLAPLVGGILDALFGWRSSFLVFAACGLAVFAWCWRDLGETNDHPASTFREQFQAYPGLLRSRRYWGYVSCMMFSTGAFYVFLAGAPLVADTALALSPAMLGFCMGTITAGFALGSFVAGRLASGYPLTTTMIAGRLVACAGLVTGLALFAAGYVNPASLFGATVFAGIGNGLTMPGANAGALSVRPALAGSASGLAGAMTIGGGAVLSSITGVVVGPEHGAYQLLGVMLFCVLLGLAAAVDVARVDKRHGSRNGSAGSGQPL